MLHKTDLARLFAFGAQLDAWAAKVSRHLGKQVPEFKNILEQNRLDELEHARVLSGLTTAVPEGEYARVIGEAAMSEFAGWNAALLNFVERRSEIQFRLAWRLTRNSDLLQIASDEARHVKTGREILKSLNVPSALYDRVRHFLNDFDYRTGTTDLAGLRRINRLVCNELQGK